IGVKLITCSLVHRNMGGGEVYKVQTYLKVRQAYNLEGKSERRIANELNVDRRTVRKMLEYSSPPGYKRQKDAVSPKLDPYKEWIDQVLETDKKVHRKQRHTVKRIHHRLRDELGFTGCYTIVRGYVSKKLLKSKEMFVPLAHEPGMAQCDFGEAQVTIAGKSCKAHYLVMQLPYSDAVFVKAYPAENTEAFCDGHASAFIFFGGVPYRILYDNTTIAVKKILDNGMREQTSGFISLKSHYLFTEGFANPARGNEKGGVENLVGFVRRNFMVPRPQYDSFDAFNEHLEHCCRQRQAEVKRGHDETVAQRLLQEQFLPLPGTPYECCRIRSGKINSQGLVRFGNNDYSVPTYIGQQKVLVKGYVDRVVIIFDHKIIAEHKRSYGAEEICFNPLHYLKLLERKIGAFEQAAPLKGWQLPPVFKRVQNALCRKDKKDGLRAYVRILRLLESHTVAELTRALESAVELDIVDEMAIRHLLKRQLEGRPPNLSLLNHPAISLVNVDLPDLSVYGQLCASGRA
ncbi:MAG: IS21 family transposase, partial [Alphaproteobacteria bacterium]